jgi:ureidoacrylate peracid hydrolase
MPMDAVATDPWIPERVRAAVRSRYGTEHVHAGFDPTRTALIVVDMQEAFLRPEGGYVACAAALDIMPAINRLADTLRAASGMVVWLKNIHDGDTDTDWPVMVSMAGEASNARRAAALSPEAPGFALAPELDVRPQDAIVVKRRYSAFLQGSSDLEAILRAKNVDTLLMAGTTTDVCVESTTRDAMMCNFKVIVVSDATAALSPEMHVGALGAMYFHFADVMPTAMVLDEIAARVPARA